MVVWLAFNYPALQGKVRFPTDFAEPSLLASRGGGRPGPRSNPVDGDAFFSLYPWQSYLGRSLAQGRLPLWDPYRFLGSPFAANIATGSWYPPNWLYATGSILTVSTLILMGTQLVALMLAYWFFRVLQLHPFAAALGSMTFVLSGFLVGWGQHGLIVGSASWLPLALGGLEVARRRSVRLGVPVGGAGLALSVLAGHAQIALYVWLTVAVWAAVMSFADALHARHAGRRKALAQVGRGAAIAVPMFLIGAGLSALPILGATELAGQIVRQNQSYQGLLLSRLRLQHLPTLLIPDYLGNPLDGNYAGSANYTETAWYAGIVPVLLAGFALRHRWERLTLGFGLLGALGALAAFGSPVFRLLYLAVPGVSRTSSLPRFVFFVDFALAGLAALGLHMLLCQRPGGRRLVEVFLVIGGIIALLTLATPGTPLKQSYLGGKGALALGAATAGTLLLLALRRFPNSALPALALLGLVGADLWLFGFRYHPFQAPRPIYPETSEVRRLASAPSPRPRFIQVDDSGRWSLPFNIALVHGLYSLNGYDPFIPKSFVDLLSLAQEQTRASTNFIPPFSQEAAGSPVMDLLGVWSAVSPLLPPPTEHFTGPFAVAARADPAPPAFVTGCWRIAGDSAALKAVKSLGTAELRRIAILEASPATRKATSRLQPECTAAPRKASIDSYQPETVRITTPDLPGGLLVLTDQWFPGWRARVDGREVPVLRVDGALRGVMLTNGSHRVTFTYEPGWLRRGMLLTGLTAALCLLWLLLPGLWPRLGAYGSSRLNRTPPPDAS